MDQRGIRAHNRAASLFSSEQFCALGEASPSVLLTLWGGLGLGVWRLPPSQLQQVFGTDSTECLKNGKSGEESEVKAKFEASEVMKSLFSILESSDEHHKQHMRAGIC